MQQDWAKTRRLAHYGQRRISKGQSGMGNQLQGRFDFARQAKAQQEEKNLHVEMGWDYFIYGWTQVIEEVFHITIDAQKIERLSELAGQA